MTSDILIRTWWASSQSLTYAIKSDLSAVTTALIHTLHRATLTVLAMSNQRHISVSFSHGSSCAFSLGKWNVSERFICPIRDLLPKPLCSGIAVSPLVIESLEDVNDGLRDPENLIFAGASPVCCKRILLSRARCTGGCAPVVVATEATSLFKTQPIVR